MLCPRSPMETNCPILLHFSCFFLHSFHLNAISCIKIRFKYFITETCQPFCVSTVPSASKTGSGKGIWCNSCPNNSIELVLWIKLLEVTSVTERAVCDIFIVSYFCCNLIFVFEASNNIKSEFFWVEIRGQIVIKMA